MCDCRVRDRFVRFSLQYVQDIYGGRHSLTVDTEACASNTYTTTNSSTPAAHSSSYGGSSDFSSACLALSSSTLLPWDQHPSSLCFSFCNPPPVTPLLSRWFFQEAKNKGRNDPLGASLVSGLQAPSARGGHGGGGGGGSRSRGKASSLSERFDVLETRRSRASAAKPPAGKGGGGKAKASLSATFEVLERRSGTKTASKAGARAKRNTAGAARPPGKR